jgi:hypothetical protein
MKKIRLFFGRFLIAATVCYFFFNPSLLQADSGTEKDKESAAWQEYNNPESGFLFTYPTGWKITDDFFYQSAGAAGTDEGVWTIILQQIGKDDDSNNWIRINSPQFQKLDGTCITISQQDICTYSREISVLEVLKRIAASFRMQKNK